MLTLSLFRHAKSSRDDASVRDLDRPLNERGRKAAPTMGAYLAAQALRPDLVLASPSVRTRETCELALAAFAPLLKVQFVDVLYLASPRTLLEQVRHAPAGVRHLMIIGHNPGLQALALDLIAKGERTAISALAAKLPTAGLVVMELDVPDWTRVAPATARLARFVTPATL